MKNLGLLTILMFCTLISYAQTTVTPKQKVINNETVNSFESPTNIVSEFQSENKVFIQSLNVIPLNQSIPANVSGSRTIVYPTGQSSTELTKLNSIINSVPQLRVINKSQVVIDDDGPTPILLPTEPIAPIKDPEIAPEQQ